MTFKDYDRKEISYEEQQQIEENKEKVEMTLNCVWPQLTNAIIHNAGTDNLGKQLASVVELSNNNNYFINVKQGPITDAQKEMKNDIDFISDCVKKGLKTNFFLDMEKKKYISVNKEQDIGLSLCSLYPVNASRPIVLLTDESQRLEMYTYVGNPRNRGMSYILYKDYAGSFYLTLQEFHFLSLRKDEKRNFDHGLLLSYNYKWGWKNISFSFIRKENQDMVRKIFDYVKNPPKPIENPDSNKMNMGTVYQVQPWQ